MSYDQKTLAEAKKNYTGLSIKIKTGIWTKLGYPTTFDKTKAINKQDATFLTWCNTNKKWSLFIEYVKSKKR